MTTNHSVPAPASAKRMLSGVDPAHGTQILQHRKDNLVVTGSHNYISFSTQDIHATVPSINYVVTTTSLQKALHVELAVLFLIEQNWRWPTYWKHPTPILANQSMTLRTRGATSSQACVMPGVNGDSFASRGEDSASLEGAARYPDEDAAIRGTSTFVVARASIFTREGSCYCLSKSA